MKFLRWFVLFLAAGLCAKGAVTNGCVSLQAGDLAVGTTIVLTGDWNYKPGYMAAPGIRPETDVSTNGYLPVAVPQFLNRIHWWLDDSVDFDRHETARLKKMGFDTDRAEDGWYQMRVDVPAVPADRRFYLEFEGVAMKCKTYCNGQLLGEHKGMFSRFDYDLTGALHAGTNWIAVYVSMEKIEASKLAMGQAVTVNLTASKVLTMSKGMYGPLWPGADNRSYDLHGIWQPVRLVVRGRAHIDDVWFEPKLDGGKLRIASHLLDRQVVKASAHWIDLKTGSVFAQAVTFSKGPVTGAISNFFELVNVRPKLWTPAEPNLYRLEVSLEDEKNNLLDTWSGNVGFRTFKVDGNEFYLNGHPWWLRGADHLPYGKNPWDPALPRKLIQLMHDAHLEITRTHATPWNESWLDAADEIGLAVSIEGIRPWGLSGQIGPTPPAMFQHWLMENEDVIKRCRNHPSVFIYTVGNEMMLKDSKNLEKWKQLSQVVGQTRALDPSRPVIASSEYQRDPKFYKAALLPNKIDDGDIDDLHRYNNWYAPSSFVVDAKLETEVRRNGGRRPLIGQEMSTGYPDLDTGLPVFRYTHDLMTPQAWVGNAAYPGADPSLFLEHHRAVTKRWAERLRFERGTNTAGFMLFAAECWFSHSYDAALVKPYPVYEAMREADEPIGLALETGRRRFFAGEKIETAIFISNDDDQFRALRDARLEASLDNGPAQPIGILDRLQYHHVDRVPVVLTMPESDRHRMSLTIRLVDASGVRSTTIEPIEVFPKTAAPDTNGVVTIAAGKSLDGLKVGGSLRAAVEGGATVVVFSPSSQMADLFPDAVRDSKKFEVEYADFSPMAGTPLGAALQPMDLKWWGRANDWRTFCGGEAQRLQPGGPARPLIRYIPPHGYISADKLPDQRWAVMWELRLGKGRLWVCDLDLDQCAEIDPAARLFAKNLYQAAADPRSTDSLPAVLSHEELCKESKVQ